MGEWWEGGCIAPVSSNLLQQRGQAGQHRARTGTPIPIKINMYKADGGIHSYCYSTRKKGAGGNSDVCIGFEGVRTREASEECARRKLIRELSALVRQNRDRVMPAPAPTGNSPNIARPPPGPLCHHRLHPAPRGYRENGSGHKDHTLPHINIRKSCSLEEGRRGRQGAH